MPVISKDHPAVLEGRTLFSKSVRKVTDNMNTDLFKPGSTNAKLGYKVTKGRWRGKYIYSLTLEERKTCPKYCHHWADCYGNNLYLAHRFEHGIALESRIRKEIQSLLDKHPDGVVIRLHVLGDFYSVKYVKLWKQLLKYNPKLCVFGYTARYNEPIADAVEEMNKAFPDRCVIRYSVNRSYIKSKKLRFAVSEEFKGSSFICPNQTVENVKCSNCAACWQTTKSVRFITH